MLKNVGNNNAVCRSCGERLEHTFIDLGMSPLCESYIDCEGLNQMEPFYPLHVYVCHNCFLVQLDEYVKVEDIFSEYAYFSSYSDSWLEHARRYTDMIIEKLKLSNQSRVMELASNDGYLLQYFVEKGIPSLGVEPAANVAAVAKQKGVPTVVKFFGRSSAYELVGEFGKADLIIGNNVCAQVPDLNDFVAGMKIALKPTGVISLEFPHLLQLMIQNQFDTIYHEHFSYFSLIAVEHVFTRHQLRVFDVEELPTHGGSLRVYVCHESNIMKLKDEKVNKLEDKEKQAGFYKIDGYLNFSEKVKETKRKLLDFFIKAKRNGKVIVGYGAPGKGNTLLNYCGIRTDFIDYTVDRNPYKQGKYLPGTHIPIYEPKRIFETKPDYVVILPWNFKDEIMGQMEDIREWGGKFVVPIPEVKIYL